MYTITYAPEAKEGLAKLKRSEPASFKKAVKLLTNSPLFYFPFSTSHIDPFFSDHFCICQFTNCRWCSLQNKKITE